MHVIQLSAKGTTYSKINGEDISILELPGWPKNLLFPSLAVNIYLGFSIEVWLIPVGIM